MGTADGNYRKVLAWPCLDGANKIIILGALFSVCVGGALSDVIT